MGSETFRRLWEKRDRFDIVLLQRPSARNKKMFRRFEREAGIVPIRGRGVVRGNGLKIVWGDALNREDVEEACRGIDWCLHPMALISPAADRDPEMTYRVNYEATRMIVEAIEAQDPDRIRIVYIGSIAQYGERFPPVHVGRTGDPILPSIHDHYALSKVRAELAVMQSRIRHRVSFRQTFIMIPDLFSLTDPIMFHQPLNTFMENITSTDSGRLMVNCLDIPGDSDFWGQYFNISGGPLCRTTFLEFLDRIYRMLGIDYRRVMDRRWFALKNFHMQFSEDTERLNSYLRHWEGGETQEDYYRKVWEHLPVYLKATAWFNRYLPPFRWLVEAATRNQLKRLALRPDGTLRWFREGDSGRIEAFYGSMEQYLSIPAWGERMPSLDHEQAYERLDHGYDESKPVLDTEDLKGAAAFRGGTLVSNTWSGDMDERLNWKCCRGHSFEMTPGAVLKGGHWCMECISPPWDYAAFVKKNRFAAQVLPSLQAE